MKKLALLLVSAFGLFSCSNDNNIPGPPGPQGPPGPGVSFQIIDAIAQPNDWLPFNAPGTADYQFFVEFNAPEIDQFTYDFGVVIGYQIDGGTTYTLPNTINFDGYTREFSMYYGVGYVGFAIKDSDLQTTPPDVNQLFKVYIINADAAKEGLDKMDRIDLEHYLREMQAEGKAREVTLS